MPTVTATPASQFLNGLGVNVHMSYGGTPYANPVQVICALEYLGMSKVRENGFNITGNAELEGISALAAAGIRLDLVAPVVIPGGSSPNTINLPQFISNLNSWLIAFPGSIVAIEGANETNIWPVTYDGGTTPADQAQLQKDLWNDVQADTNLIGIPVFNTTIGSGSSAPYTALGNLASYTNFANSHVYTPAAQAVVTSFATIVALSQINATGKPQVITEAGFNNSMADTYSGIDELGQAKLTLNTLFDAYSQEVLQTFLYELFDENGTYWGLFRGDGSAKLVATAISNLTTILGGGAAQLASTSLTYTLTGMPSSSNSVLLAKTFGVFDLVIWNEAVIWNSSTMSDVMASPHTVTVTFPTAITQIRTFDPLNGSLPSNVYHNITAVSLVLTDHPLIVEVTP